MATNCNKTMALKLSLAEALAEWLATAEESGLPFSFCMTGVETARCMADAAFSVLEAIAQSQEQAEAEGYIKRED